MSDHTCTTPDLNHKSKMGIKCDSAKAGNLWKCGTCRTWWVLFKPFGGDTLTWDRVTPDHLKAWMKTRKDKWAYPRFYFMHATDQWTAPVSKSAERGVMYVDAMVRVKQFEREYDIKINL